MVKRYDFVWHRDDVEVYLSKSGEWVRSEDCATVERGRDEALEKWARVRGWYREWRARAEKAERERDDALVAKVKEIGRRKDAERERDEAVEASERERANRLKELSGQEFRGNSVGVIWDKMVAYRNGLDATRARAERMEKALHLLAKGADILQGESPKDALVHWAHDAKRIARAALENGETDA